MSTLFLRFFYVFDFISNYVFHFKSMFHHEMVRGRNGNVTFRTMHPGLIPGGLRLNFFTCLTVSVKTV